MTNLSKSIEDVIGVNFSDQLASTDAKYNQFPLGTVVRARNGRMYMYVQTGAASIADDTAVILTEPAMTVAAGAGAWTNRGGATPAAVTRIWVESNAV